MKRLPIICMWSLLVSCQQNSGLDLESLPVVSSNFDLDDLTLFKNDSLIEISPYWTKKIKSNTGSTGKVFGLAKFDIPTVDNQYIRSIQLYLVKVVNAVNDKNYLITVDANDSIVDGLKYNPETMRLKAIYQHSSSLGHEGIAVEIVEDNSTPAALEIIGYTVEIFEDGRMELISKGPNNNEIFKRLAIDCRVCGQYSLASANSKIEIEIRDGLEEGTIAFKFELKDHEGCIVTYQSLGSKFVENSILLDSLLTLHVDETGVGIAIDIKTQCGVVISENEKLARKQNTH